MKNPLAIQLEGLEPSQRPPRSTHAAQIATAGWPIREPLSLKLKLLSAPPGSQLLWSGLRRQTNLLQRWLELGLGLGKHEVT